MKKILLATIVLSCFLLGCIKDCGLGKMSKETPALKKNDYNSCRAVCENLTYYICERTPDFPYWDNIGDTIMVCGYDIVLPFMTIKIMQMNMQFV